MPSKVKFFVARLRPSGRSVFEFAKFQSKIARDGYRVGSFVTIALEKLHFLVDAINVNAVYPCQCKYPR